MVLLALGILAVSIFFLAYKYPPSKWGNQSAATLNDVSGQVNGPNPKIQEVPTNFKKMAPSETFGDNEETESSITPKAGPQNGFAQGPIPGLTLDDSPPEEELIQTGKPPPTSMDHSKTPQPSTSQATQKSTTPAMPPPSRTAVKPLNSLMPPPTIKASALRPLPRPSGNLLNPPPSLAASQRGPQKPLTAPASSLSPNAASTSTLPPSQRPSKKVLLPPGHSPLDWANLTRNPPSSNYLRGKDVPSTLVKISPTQLKERNGRKGKDAWGTWQGRVYNLTPYKNFHPGGVGELMRGAGKVGEAERLFNEIHPWVNWDAMLSECMVGILVSEGEGWGEGPTNAGNMDEMD